MVQVLKDNLEHRSKSSPITRNQNSILLDS